MSRWVLASGNAGKQREFAALLEPLGVELLPQTSLGVSEAEEPHVTFIENALAKARHASRMTGLPALADDSGLCIAALDGAPGVRSARFAEDAGQGTGDNANTRWLLKCLHGLSDRRAEYVAVLVFMSHADDPCPVVAEGHWAGRILTEPRGSGGFGYDPVFQPDGLALSVAEMEVALKNRLSHRAQALARLMPKLRGRIA
jgi:XTP/dITP diphosphohydrolase